MSQTKEELLQYFQGLNIATLQKLEKYSQQIIIPDEDLLVNVTMSQMISKAHQLADSYFPEWTDRSKSDFGEFLVELMSLFSEKDFWYINAFANESILRKMRSYSNAFSKASTLGYSPIVLKSSAASFTITFAAGEEVVYNRGDIVVNVGDKAFTNDSSFTVPQSSAPVDVTVTLQQGDQEQEDFVFDGFSVYVRRKDVAINSVVVVIDNIIYTRVGNFGESGPTSTHYMVLPEEDGSVAIYFGDNTYGISPVIGKSVQVYYRVCAGSEGNLPISTATLSDSLPQRLAESVVMVSEATGGTNQESLASIKVKAPLFFNTKRAIINETVAQDALNGFPFIRRSKVVVFNRDVTFRAIPTSGDPDLSVAELTVLSTEFYPYIMAGFYPVAANNIYRDLITSANPAATKLIVDTLIYKGYDRIVIEGAIRQILSDITNPLISAEYGNGFNRSDMDIMFRMNIKGVQSTVFKLLVGDDEVSMTDVTLEETEIFSAINQSNVIVRTNVY